MSQLGDKISGSGSDAGGRPISGKDVILKLADPTPKKVKHQSPQDAIDEFWKKFDTKTPGIASTILPKNLLAKKASEKTPKGLVKGKNAGASYEEAVAICKDKVEKIVHECHRTNTKYLDPHFDIETDLRWEKDCLTQLKSSDRDPESSAIPEGVKRVGDVFEDPKFFVEGASANDVRQGSDGDCWFLAALATLANKPDLIERICVARDEKVGVYGFVFHRDGEWVSEIIDDKLYLIKPDYDASWLERMMLDGHRRINSEEEYKKLYQTGSSALFFAQCEDPNETWLPLLEKAYAKAHGDYSVIEGGYTGEGVEDLTGGVTTELFITDILDKDYFWKEELLKVNQEFLFGCWAYFRGYGSRKGIVEGHAYSVMKAVEVDGQRLVLLRNPWGEYEWKGPWSDGSKEWTPEWMQKLDHRFGDDGVFWMSYDDLMKKYQLFDRTRLFSNEWKITQQWTTVTVPWNVDYNDTKFTFTLEKKSSVVIVLSQLDSRYFGGLEGQYDFGLSFRVHKAGEQAYLVRSYNKYNMSRSTTAELELEAGEYNVLMKIEARRNEDRWPVEKVVRENAKERREKLVRIGLSYDMAHAKGHIEETEEEKAGKKKAEAAKKAKEKKETKDKLMKEKKKRKHNENKEKRKQRAAKAKRQAKAKAKAAKRAQKEKEAKPEVKDEPKADEKKAGETKAAEPETESAPADAPADGAKPTAPTEPAKPDATVAPAAAPQTLEIRVTGPNNAPNPSAPPSIVSFLGNDDDDDDDSDINSDVSDISDGEIEDHIAEQKLAAEQVPPPPPNPEEEEEDEFEADPWNAVAVVGLRVYSKESGVSVKVVRPRDWENGEGKLDVDDSAADATKDVTAEKKSEGEGEGEEAVVKEGEAEKKTEGETKESNNVVKKEDETEKKPEGEIEAVVDKKDEETAKSEGGSEGSGVVV